MTIFKGVYPFRPDCFAPVTLAREAKERGRYGCAQRAELLIEAPTAFVAWNHARQYRAGDDDGRFKFDARGPGRSLPVLSLVTPCLS
jgi:hypothetical protein